MDERRSIEAVVGLHGLWILGRRQWMTFTASRASLALGLSVRLLSLYPTSRPYYLLLDPLDAAFGNKSPTLLFLVSRLFVGLVLWRRQSSHELASLLHD